MEKHKHVKDKGFLNISREAKIYAIPKSWDEWIPAVRKKYVKKQTFQNNAVRKYFMWSRNPYNSQTTGWVNSHITELVRENTDNSQVPLYLRDLELMGTHAIISVWEWANPHTMEIFCGKPSQDVVFEEIRTY